MNASRWYPVTALGLSGLGFADATMLTIQHYTQFTLPCSITHGCDLVTHSVYSSMFGVPVALLGALYYAGVLIAMYIAAIEFKHQKTIRWIAMATTLGFLFSAWFVYAQLFLIHAICQYCMLSALSSTTLFVVSMIYLFRTKTSGPSPSLIEAPSE